MPPKVIGPKRALSIELLLFFAYCFFSASWMVGSIVTTDMAQEFGVYTIPSSVNNAISAAKILGNFVAAWILLKLGPKRTVSLSCLLICAVVVGAFSTSFPAFILTRFLLGFGGAILMICMTPYVVYCFEPKQQPIFIGLNNAGPNTGNLIALLSVTAVRGGWVLAQRHPLLRSSAWFFWFSGSLWDGVSHCGKGQRGDPLLHGLPLSGRLTRALSL